MAGSTKRVILVDGDCALCNGFVQFVSARDSKERVYFETQQSSEGKKLLMHHGQPMDLSTMVSFEYTEGSAAKPKSFTKSTAVLRTMLGLDGLWCILAVFLIIPSFIRDFVYYNVAKYRYKMFGKTEACKLPDKVLRKRINRTVPQPLLDALCTEEVEPSEDPSAPLTRKAPEMASEQAAVWSGSGTQEEFMHKDECILVDEDDNVTGHNNKYNCHRFVPETPTGILHRAFSVFLFDDEGRLLLQQRASDKITFPDLWTNTCCSHPLFGYSPTEVDTPADLANGTLLGVKRAAIRKLAHELGISKNAVPIESFKFLTRLHYCAKDEITYGPSSEWGEHELDYILFIQAKVDFTANPEEVRDTRYVTAAELKEMMCPDNGLKWSPWFRIIAEQFLYKWWDALPQALQDNGPFVELGSIHRVL